MPAEIIPFDAEKLVADIRKGDGTALQQAYRVTFGTEMGRIVLAHHLQECGVGNALGEKKLKYSAGRHDAALLLASKAGFDQASLAVAVLTDDLRGGNDNGDQSSRTEPRFDDDITIHDD